MEQQANNTIFQTAFAIGPTASDIVPGRPVHAGQLEHNQQPVPVIPAPSAALNPGSTGRLMDPNYRTPVTEEFNGGYTWAINTKTAFEAEYVHVLSLHENKTINLDPEHPGHSQQHHHPQQNRCSRRLLPSTGCCVYAAGVPVLGSVRDETSGGRSRYDGMNLSFRQRNFHKTDLTVNYTLARAVGYDQDGGSFRYYPRDPQNPLRAE